jgi:hypothetical protein
VDARGPGSRRAGREEVLSLASQNRAFALSVQRQGEGAFPMSVRLRRYPEYGVTFFMFSGVLVADELRRLFEGLDRRDAGRWLSYGDDTVEMTGIKVSDLPALKQLMHGKQKELFGDSPPPNAMVYSSKHGEELLRFWQLYTLIGDVRPMTPAVFSNLNAACRWLTLPADACAKFEAEVGSPERGAPGG